MTGVALSFNLTFQLLVPPCGGDGLRATKNTKQTSPLSGWGAREKTSSIGYPLLSFAIKPIIV